MINIEELRVAVGVKGYKIYTGENFSSEEYNTDKTIEKHEHGVYVGHVPTGNKIYINLYKSQIMNKEIAIKILENRESCLINFND